MENPWGNPFGKCLVGFPYISKSTEYFPCLCHALCEWSSVCRVKVHPSIHYVTNTTWVYSKHCPHMYIYILYIYTKYIYICIHIDCSILQHCSPDFASMHHQAYQTVLYFELLNEVAPLQLPNAQLHDMRWCPCWCFPHISAWRSHKVTPKDSEVDKHN